MIKIYTVSSCTSCKKAKTWLNAHQLTYKEQNLGKEGITKKNCWISLQRLKMEWQVLSLQKIDTLKI